eukprot:scaffold9851_cov100-Isochrysis_galbana.AAC.4
MSASELRVRERAAHMPPLWTKLPPLAPETWSAQVRCGHRGSHDHMRDVAAKAEGAAGAEDAREEVWPVPRLGTRSNCVVVRMVGRVIRKGS